MRSARNLLGVLAPSVALLVVFGFAWQGGTDRLIERDGRTVYGHLSSVDATRVVIDNQSIPRASVRYIIFSGAHVPRLAKANNTKERTGGSSTDAVTLRGGDRTFGPVTKVTDKLVVQGTVQYRRAEVAVIEFDAEPPSAKTLTAEPNRSPSATPSPTPSPSPSQSVGATENSNDNSSGSNTSSGGGSGSMPPWLSKNPDKGSCAGGWGTIHIEGISCFKNCSVTITVCGHAVKVLRWTPPNGPENSEEVSEYLGLNSGNFVCCSKLRESKKSLSPCDGTKDLDCDGVPDAQDDYPTDPTRSKRPENQRP